MSKCELCVFNEVENNKDICINCKDNPLVQKILASLPKSSSFTRYIPVCPKGYTDCIYDPAYIECYDPEWYKDLYGDLSPEEAVRTESECCRNFNSKYCNIYDNEDK